MLTATSIPFTDLSAVKSRPHTLPASQRTRRLPLHRMEVDADDDWAKRARAGFFSSPRSLFSEPDEGASSWAPPAHAPATVTRHSSHNAQFNTSDTLTPRGPALPGTGPVRGFVPTSRSLGSRDSAFSRTSREPWTPEDPTPLASAEPTNYSQSLGRLRPRPLSFAFDVANSSVPQTLFGNAIREPHSGLYDHPPLAISRDVNGRSLPPAVPRTPPAQRGEGNAMAASRVAKKRKGSKEKSSSSRQAKSAAEKQVQKTTVSTSIDSLPDEILIQSEHFHRLNAYPLIHSDSSAFYPESFYQLTSSQSSNWSVGNLGRTSQ